MNSFDFNGLYVLDLANNHQGSVEHGKNIIQRNAEVAHRHGVRAAIKFQFRDLPEFVHVDERKNPTNKHVPRFLSTQLGWDQFGELLQEIWAQGLLAMCTPFDEASVKRIVAMGFDIIKVASCSARDWPLLEQIAESGLPVVASTGGLSQNEVDDLVSFFQHRGCDFALMHCVSIYPTPDSACNLANINGFRQRYPGRTIGWSTHEAPDDTIPVGIAMALGAQMFERHVGIATDTISLNAYSSTPEQVDTWIAASLKARALIGKTERQPALDIERQSIDELRRGVFARRPVEAGQVLTQDDVYFAFPYRAGQLSSGDWKEGIVAQDALVPDEPATATGLTGPNERYEAVLKDAIHDVKALLAYAHVPLSHDFTTEYSHHYGVSNFRKVGAVLINVINRAYAKKVIVQLAGQRHPLHYHKLKEETFLVLWGELISELDGRERILKPGDTLTVPPGVWHCFRTETGCVFEEISTTAFSNDSVYRDAAINRLTSTQRKTSVDHWGRFQIVEQLRDAEVPTA